VDRQQSLGVVLIEPLHVVRMGLRLLISDEAGLEIEGEAGTSDEGLRVLRSLQRRTDVLVLVGLGLDGEHDAFWMIRSVREQFPSMWIVACGANGDGSTVSRALFFGADGFVDKATDPAEFLQALRDVAQGTVVLAGLPLNSFGDVVDELDRQRLVEPVLTEREREVISVAAQGLTARQIGDRLGVRERTVTTHLGRIYRKLGCSTRMSAVSAAQRSGLLSLAVAE
jgi:two-component system response regulator DevR